MEGAGQFIGFQHTAAPGFRAGQEPKGNEEWPEHQVHVLILFLAC